ncbi:MAG: hypothetical protein MRY83_22420 [Flavobacteriales bacterium]|nr:hypothetical protein [Flavobacteriales bacterium]
MKGQQIDFLNIFLIVLSLIAALIIPFRLFLFSYAVLGPLHYLTEINWLKEKNYFIPGKHKGPVRILIALSIGICIAPVLYGFLISDLGQSTMDPDLSNHILNEFVVPISKVGDLLILAAFITAICFLLFKELKVRLICSGLAIFVCFLMSYLPFYRLAFVVLLPTFIHVYLFTAAFMLYGAIKSSSAPGYASVLLFISIPFILMFIDVDYKSIGLNEYIKDNMVKSNFLYVLDETSKFIGMNKGKDFSIISATGIKLQVFLAFAYTYHYLNWFSKTATIKWHKIAKKRMIISIVLWLVFISIYAYDYHIGFIMAFVLSFIHVLFEFPLNARSFEFIGKWVYEKAWAKRTV